MNPKSQPLPRSAFAAFCAFALAASMALPFMGASKSYAEEVEASAAEAAQDDATPASKEDATPLLKKSEQNKSVSSDSGEEAKSVEVPAPAPGTAICYVKDWKALSFPTGPNGFVFEEGTSAGTMVPVTVEGNKDAIAVIGGGQGMNMPHNLSFRQGNLVWEGLGNPYDNADAFSLTDGTFAGGFAEGVIPLPCVEGKTIVSVTLIVDSVDKDGYVTHLTVKPVYAGDGDLGVVVTDKNARMDIPVIYDPGHSDNPVFSFTASGILNGANVPEGSRVYVKCNPSGASANSLGWAFRLVVDGQYVTGDFGTVTLTAPACIPGQADGKTHQITVKTSEGAEDTFPMALVEGAKVTVTMTKCDVDYGAHGMAFCVNIVLGNIIEGGSQGNSSQGGSSQSISVEGDTGIAASGTLSGVNIPKGADVTVGAKKVTAGDAYEALTSKLGSKLFGDVFEVTLLANGEEVHDGFGKLTLSFPVGEENNGYNFTVYHCHQDGHISAEPAVAKNGAVTITVTDLSSFALVKGEKASTGTGDKSEAESLGGSALAQTGDTTPVLAFGGFALAALGAIAFAGYRARKSALK